MPKFINQRVSAEYYVVKDPATIGRHPSNDVVLPVPSVSRFHLEVGTTQEGYYIQDLGSTYSTRLNQQAITGRAALASGDRIQLGITSAYPVGAFDLIFSTDSLTEEASATAKAMVAERETVEGGRWTCEQVDGVLVAKLCGHFRQPTCDTIMDAIYGEVQTRLCDLVLDMQDVQHMNSHAIGSLTQLRTNLMELGQFLVIAAASGHVYKLLDTLDLTSVFGCYSSRHGALRAIRALRNIEGVRQTRAVPQSPAPN